MLELLGRYHEQPPATQRKCKHSVGACSFKQGQDLSQRFQSALALSQAAGTDPWKRSVYLWTDLGLCNTTIMLLSGFTVRTILKPHFSQNTRLVCLFFSSVFGSCILVCTGILTQILPALRQSLVQCMWTCLIICLICT